MSMYDLRLQIGKYTPPYLTLLNNLVLTYIKNPDVETPGLIIIKS
jgi:hypothetical protein